jgi:hypothetical protein
MDDNNYIMLSRCTTESETLSTLPLLLTGPVLRRIEPKQVCIWVARSKALSIQAEIFRGRIRFLDKRKTEGSYNEMTINLVV